MQGQNAQFGTRMTNHDAGAGPLTRVRKARTSRRMFGFRLSVSPLEGGGVVKFRHGPGGRPESPTKERDV
jgi:hypothetical protein